jgi:hypothetical protein
MYLQFGESLPVEEALVVEVPAGIVSKPELLATLYQQLGCPGAGANWDALFDTLCDLSWLQARPVVIRHADLPFAAGRKSRAVYLQILNEAVRRHQQVKSPPPQLSVEFPAESQTAATQLLAGRGSLD